MPAALQARLRELARFLATPGFGRRLALLLVLALTMKLAVNLTAYVMIDRTAKQDAVAESFQEVRRAARSLLIGTLAAETAQRAFLLTGDPAFEDRARQGLQEADAALSVLSAEAADDADLAPLVAEAREAARDKARELGVTLDLTAVSRGADAVRIMQSGQGQALTDRLRTSVEAIDELATARLSTARAGASAGLRTVGVMNGISSLLIVGLGVAIGWLIRTYIRDMQAARMDLDRLNAGLEDQVRDRTLALTRANEEIQRFAYIVSHDLRAPLVNVMGYTAELEASGKAMETQLAVVEDKAPKLVQPDAVIAVREDVPEAIGFIRTSTEKMDRLINAILRLSRDGRRALRPERLDLTAMAEQIAASVNHQVEEQGARIEVSKIPAVTSDRLTIEQLIGNLVDNAVKYLDPGRPGVIRVEGVDLGDRVAVRVIDNGRGVAERDLERIFELFRRAGKQDRPGEGLGLAFVRNGARRLGGDVEVSSVAGEGSTFSLILPKTLSVTESGDPA
jgi:signal transduction histidine kinase